MSYPEGQTPNHFLISTFWFAQAVPVHSEDRRVQPANPKATVLSAQTSLPLIERSNIEGIHPRELRSVASSRPASQTVLERPDSVQAPKAAPGFGNPVVNSAGSASPTSPKQGAALKHSASSKARFGPAEGGSFPEAAPRPAAARFSAPEKRAIAGAGPSEPHGASPAEQGRNSGAVGMAVSPQVVVHDHSSSPVRPGSSQPSGEPVGRAFKHPDSGRSPASPTAAQQGAEPVTAVSVSQDPRFEHSAELDSPSTGASPGRRGGGSPEWARVSTAESESTAAVAISSPGDEPSPRDPHGPCNEDRPESSPQRTAQEPSGSAPCSPDGYPPRSVQAWPSASQPPDSPPAQEVLLGPLEDLLEVRVRSPEAGVRFLDAAGAGARPGEPVGGRSAPASRHSSPQKAFAMGQSVHESLEFDMEAAARRHGWRGGGGGSPERPWMRSQEGPESAVGRPRTATPQVGYVFWNRRQF